MCNKLIVREFFVLSSRLQRYDIYARWLLQSYKKIVRLEKFSVYFTILLYFLSCFLLLHKKNSSLGELPSMKGTLHAFLTLFLKNNH